MNEASEARPPSRGLTKTGGFLTGFTHTLQPYIGCRFACSYCYVQGMSVHHFHQPPLPWGEYAHPREGIDKLVAKELAGLKKRGQLEETFIFMSSATDPYQGVERHWALTRGCLQAMAEHPPALVMVQTRSPLAARDFDLMAALGDRCWLSITLETDQDEIRQQVTPKCPSIQKRLALIKSANKAGLNVQIAVSPALLFSSVPTFGQLLADYAHRIVIDTFSGDGKSGKRTARTTIPSLYESSGWDPWQSEERAIELYEWLKDKVGNRVGWSQEGFTQLTKYDN